MMDRQAYKDAAEVLFETWDASSGASPGAGRILRACHQGEGRVDLLDFARLSPARREAALRLFVSTIEHGADGLPLAPAQIAQVFEEEDQ